MSKLLNTISQLLESPSSLLTADEFERLDVDMREQFVDWGILTEANPALSVVCDECESGHVEDCTRTTTHDGSSTYRIACPEAGWVEVPKSRLKQWTLSTSNLTALLADGINVDSRPETLLSGTAWRLGNVEIGGATYVLAISKKHAASTAVGMVSQPSRTILVTPSGGTDLTIDVAATLNLAEAFEVNGKTVCLNAERIRAELGVDQACQNEFRKRGEMWVSTFEGKTVYLQDTVGMTYVARLLSEANRNVPAVTLLAARVGIDERISEGSSGELLDEEARKQYADQYKDLVNDLEDANGNNDPIAAEKIQAEMGQLATELSRATGLGNRKRIQNDVEKVRKSVSMAVTRAIEKVSKVDKSLGKHLTISISSGSVFRYEPAIPVDWVV